MKYTREIKYPKPYTVRDVLKIALEKEKLSYKFYDGLLKEAKELKLFSILKRLRDSEGVHVKIIQRMLESEKNQGVDVWTTKFKKYATKEKYKKPGTFEDALKLALAREKSAADFYNSFYKQMLGNTENLSLLVVLKKLGNAEKGHVTIVERLLKNKIL